MKKKIYLEVTVISEDDFLELANIPKKKEEEKEEYYTLTEARKIIGCSSATLYRKREEGLITAITVGGTPRITKSEINRYLNKQ